MSASATTTEATPSVVDDPGASQHPEARYREVDEFILEQIAKYAAHHHCVALLSSV